MKDLFCVLFVCLFVVNIKSLVFYVWWSSLCVRERQFNMQGNNENGDKKKRPIDRLSASNTQRKQQTNEEDWMRRRYSNGLTTRQNIYAFCFLTFANTMLSTWFNLPFKNHTRFPFYLISFQRLNFDNVPKNWPKTKIIPSINCPWCWITKNVSA